MTETINVIEADAKADAKAYPPECDDGNKEYKLKLSNNEERQEQLTSQMRYRVQEGGGEAIYTIGIMDDGTPCGLTEEEYEENKIILEKISKKNNFTATMIFSQPYGDKNIYEFLIRENVKNKYINLKVACVGNVDSGKSTILGVLMTNCLDNGRGSARLNIFNFKHEMKSGRTSSIAQHILGFDEKGTVVNYDALSRKKTWPEIVSNSSKVVTFFDLCGHSAYLKTTILGLTSQVPDIVLLLVGANMGVSKMTKEHMFLCLSLHIPFVVLITKIDICKDRKNVMDDTIKEIKGIIKSPGVRRMPYDVRSEEDIFVASKNIHSNNTVPIFYVSSVTGDGIEYVRKFLNLTSRKTEIIKTENNVEFHCDQTFLVTGVGLVLGGQLVTGKVKVGDKLLLGPNNNVYNSVQIRSIHVKRVNVQEVESGCYVCLAVKKPENVFPRRGHVLIGMNDKSTQVREFDADILVLKHHSTTIKVGYEPVVHTGSIRQTARITKIIKKGGGNEENALRTGDRATISFRFSYSPEYIKNGVRILLCEGQVKIVGKICNVTEETVEKV